uniref:Uncharacterized protein n=1 Tax=viral metagenome TaxID=1070528 RepID=A0A6M3JEK6_9ZZZZ
MQHYQSNVTAVMLFCSTCNRKTMHRVDDNRVGNCMEPHVAGMSKAQLKRLKDKEKHAIEGEQEVLDL